jgi:hypothetical protein
MKKAFIIALFWTLCFVLGTFIGANALETPMVSVGDDGEVIRYKYYTNRGNWRGTGNDVQILEHMQKMKGKPYYPTRGWKHDKMPKYSDPKYKDNKFLGRVAWRDWFDYERYEHPFGIYHNDDALMLMYSYCDENDVCFSIMIEDMGIKR